MTSALFVLQTLFAFGDKQRSKITINNAKQITIKNAQQITINSSAAKITTNNGFLPNNNQYHEYTIFSTEAHF